MNNSRVLVNGKSCDYLAVQDRGLSYGDGVFRTFRIQDGVPCLWERHYKKLYADCTALSIACPAEAVLYREVAMLAHTEDTCVGKVIITRGPGHRGYAPPEPTQVTRIVMTSPFPQYPAHYATHGVKVCLCTLRLSWQPRLAGIKHLNRLEQVLARQEWSNPDTFEGIMCDLDGTVIEGTMTNIFLVEDGILYTPDLSRCGVAGVQREQIIEQAGQQGIPLHIQPISLEQLKRADEILLCNSLIGLWRVRELEGTVWPEQGAYSKLLR